MKVLRAVKRICSKCNLKLYLKNLYNPITNVKQNVRRILLYLDVQRRNNRFLWFFSLCQLSMNVLLCTEVGVRSSTVFRKSLLKELKNLI